jgi:hypothetical protein
VTTTPSHLHTSLLCGWDRAVLRSLAEDLGHELVDVVLPLLPEAAPELARLLQDHEGYNELWLLRNHASLLWRHARAELLARLDAVLPMLSPVEVLARIAADAPADELPEIRALALAALAREEEPMRRGRALLEWAPFEAPDRRAAMIAEALDLALAGSPGCVYSLVGQHVSRFDAAQRAALRAIAQRPEAARHASSILVMLACKEPADEALADALAALDRSERGEAADRRSTLCALLDVVPFARLQPWAETWIDTLSTRRDLCFAAHQLAPHASVEILDRLLARADEIDVELWGRVQILADVVRYHPTRGEALREQVRKAITRIIGDATLGHGLRPEDVPEGANLIALQAHAIARVGPVLGSDAAPLQRLVLARIAEMPSEFEHRYVLDGLMWGELGATLDAGVRADAVQAALSLRHRPSALKALGEMVANFPPESRHLVLDGLSRLADATPPEAMNRALDALARAQTGTEAKARAKARSTHGLGVGGDTFSGWTSADERSLAPLAKMLASGEYLYEGTLRELAHPLTPAAASRAVGLVLGLTSASDRLSAIPALVSAPRIGKPEREELLSALLKLVVEERTARFDAAELAQSIGELCAIGDAAWAERVAAFIDAQRPEREAFLDLVAAFAPLLRRLGGPEMVGELIGKLKAPLPVPEFARPWAAAARGTFDA